MGPACAIGSRATLPADTLAASVILANDCADYLECVGMVTGAQRRAYLRETAESYCRECDVWPDRFDHEARSVAEVESYMRRHVAAYVARIRELRRQRRAADRAKESA